MLERLAAFDTTRRNSNLELIHDVHEYLSGRGVSSQLSFDESGGKANLYDTIGQSVHSGVAPAHKPDEFISLEQQAKRLSDKSIHHLNF